MERRTDDKEGRPARKAYTSPRLVEYGDVRKLTQTGGHTTHDGAAGAKKLGG